MGVPKARREQPARHRVASAEQGNAGLSDSKYFPALTLKPVGEGACRVLAQNDHISPLSDRRGAIYQWRMFSRG